MAEKLLVAVVDDFVNPEKGEPHRSDALNDIVTRISSGKLKLHQLVENMGDYLPSKDEVVRGRATLLLSEVIARLPDLPIEDAALHFLAAFYADRLQDFPSISEVLQGIVALLDHHKVSEEDVITIIRSITTEIVDQGYMVSLSQNTRMNLLKIFAIVLEKHASAAKGLKADFVFSFVRVLDGERDPRNLLLGFKTFIQVTHTVPEFVRFAEELFEVVSVYFPVTFTPKPNDPYGISKEDLVDNLRACFAASSELAQYCIPFLLDKESSTLTETKLDAMETLTLCAKSYGSLTMSKYIEDIWPALRTEVLTSKEARVVDKALETVTDLTKVLSLDVVTIASSGKVSSNLREFLDPLINQCLHELRSPDSKIAISCGKILQSAATASVRACIEILKDTFPVLLRQFKLEDRPSHKQSLLDLIINFVTASCQFDVSTVEEHPLQPYRDQLFTTFTGVFASESTLSSAKFRISAITGLRSLLLADMLDPSQSEVVLLRLTKSVLDDKDAVVRSNALRALDMLAHQSGKTALVEKHTIPALLDAITAIKVDSSESSTLPQPKAEGDEHIAESDGHALTSVLGSLAVLASEPALCRILVPKLLHITESQWADIKSTSSDGRAHSIPAHVLETLSRIINATGALIDASEWTSVYCPAILKLLINETGTLPPNSAGSTDFMHALNSTVRIFGAVTRSLESGPTRAKFVDSVVTLYLTGKSEQFVHEVSSFQPLEHTSPTSQKLLVKILTVVIGSADRDTPIASVSEVLNRLFTLTDVLVVANGERPSKVHELIALSVSQGIASVLNKLSEDSPELKEFLTQKVSLLQQRPGPDSNAIFQSKEDSIRTLTWVTKALVMRGHPKGKELASDLITLLSSTEERENKKISVLAAHAMDVIIGESQHILNANTSSRIRVLYKQRFFSEVLPTLLKGFQSSAAPARPPYLLAISYLLKHIPKSVLLSELPTVLPLIVQSIASQDAGLISSTLKTLSMLVAEAPDMVSQHLSSFVPELLRLSTFKANMNIRIDALDCLSSFITLPFYKIFPYQKKITNELGRALDDPKRAVRKAAVRCRNQWFGLKTDNTTLRKPNQQ